MALQQINIFYLNILKSNLILYSANSNMYNFFSKNKLYKIWSNNKLNILSFS